MGLSLTSKSVLKLLVSSVDRTNEMHGVWCLCSMRLKRIVQHASQQVSDVTVSLYT